MAASVRTAALITRTSMTFIWSLLISYSDKKVRPEHRLGRYNGRVQRDLASVTLEHLRPNHRIGQVEVANSL
jgi:hypothetical protein